MHFWRHASLTHSLLPPPFGKSSYAPGYLQQREEMIDAVASTENDCLFLGLANVCVL